MPYEVFISYSHADRKLLDELAKHLSNLRKQGIISNWFDGDILPGTVWRTELMNHLNQANIILLLVSADFINSDFCYDIEMIRAIERHDADEARVLPIILRPCDWAGTPFAELQALPDSAKPVVIWPTHDEAFTDVVKGIRKAINDLKEKGKAPTP
jgi:TIR domain